MIPLLMAVGVLLVGIGVLSWVAMDPAVVGTGDPDESGTASSSHAWANTLILIVRFVAIPMGLLLVVGALYFRMEVKRALRNKR